MEKKEISPETTVKAIITGFASYGIIVFFICIILAVIGDYFLSSLPSSNSTKLYITIPLIATFFIYFIIHGVCRLSTYDVFKKCKTNPQNYKIIGQNLNMFFGTCIILAIVLFLSLLYLNLKYQVKSIEFAELQYESIYSSEHTGLLMKEMEKDFNLNKMNLTTSTLILVIGVAISILSLIPYQKKMLIRYNNFENAKN